MQPRGHLDCISAEVATLTRKPIFWILFVFIALVSGGVAVRYFSAAFPIVTLDLKMDRARALQEARRLAERYDWGPRGFRQAASFELDEATQNLVELEGGGSTAFREMLRGDLYSPYKWRVRHFSSGETLETRVFFTPQGEPYGFRQKLPEDEPGESLETEQAIELAENSATRDWGIDLSKYQRVEVGKERRSGGRTDHSLVYERPELEIAEGRYRLRLVVSGDRFTGLIHFVQIPEAFERRYSEMRSANSAIGAGGFVGLVFFVLIGCVGGLSYLLRRRWVIWRQPIRWGLLVSLLMALTSANQWPLLWMDYDTAVPAGTFVLQKTVLILAGFLGLALLYGLSFMAAESLTRRAFPHHLQLWKAWSPEGLGSVQLLGRTAAAYLLVAVFFAYEVVLYLVSGKYFGWWTPSEVLFDPDVLATYFPWLSSITISLQAGFWEECLFRAVPLAGAALLGQRFGRRRAWIIGALLLQAVIFGAGHADYPAQPAYARVVELILPAIGFGLVYLAYGLLPVIVLHFVFDVVWFALPLFVSTAPGAWANQVMVVLLALIPIWMVLWGRWRSPSWREVDDSIRNSAWSPPPDPPSVPAAESTAPLRKLNRSTRRLAVTIGVIGLALWGLFSEFRASVPAFTISRQQAIDVARLELSKREVELKPPWKALASVESPLVDSVRYVWQVGGEEAYRRLSGVYLPLPRWKVRFARFDGDLVERAEEYLVWVGARGKVTRVGHKLPESRSGAALTEEQAQGIALEAIADKYGLIPAQLERVSATPSKRADRTDWLLTFQSEADNPLEEGEQRSAVAFAGDEVADIFRYFHVPEHWSREQQGKVAIQSAIVIFSWILIIVLLLAGLIKGVVNWSQRPFSVRFFLFLFVGLGVLNLLNLFNRLPVIMARLSTTEPISRQLVVVVGISLIAALVMAAATGLLIGFLRTWIWKGNPEWSWKRAAAGFGLGFFGAGLVAVGAALAPQTAPTWGAYDAAGTLVPILSAALQPLGTYIQITALLLLLYAGVDRFCDGWKSRKSTVSIAMALMGLALVGSTAPGGVVEWLVGGSLVGLLMLAAYLLILRYDLTLIPLAVGAGSLLTAVRQGAMGSYPTAFPGAILGSALILIAAYLWFRSLQRESTESC